MTPKRINFSISKGCSKLKKSPPKVSETQKNALSNMFKRIESSDSNTIECPRCNEQIKSCLLKDHSVTKCKYRATNKIQESQTCLNRIKSTQSSDTIKNNKNNNHSDDVVILEDLCTDKFVVEESYFSGSKFEIKSTIITRHSSSKSNISSQVKESPQKPSYENNDQINRAPSMASSKDAVKFEFEDAININPKRFKSEENNGNFCENKILNEVLSTHDTRKTQAMPEEVPVTVLESNFESVKEEPREYRVDFYLENFFNAIQSVLSEKTFSCLLDSFDYETIDTFSSLSSKNLFFFAAVNCWLWV